MDATGIQDVVLANVVLGSRYSLVWDDPQLLTEVARVADSGRTAKLFASDFRLRANQDMGYYRPLTQASLWWQVRDHWRAGGEAALPAASRSLHAASLAMHAACALLVWLLLRRAAGSGVVPWLVAALFAVHPAHVETIAFISARTDLLAAMCVLASMLCWSFAGSATGRTRAITLVLGSLLAVAGALAKEQALLLPVVLVAWSLLLPRGTRGGWWTHNRGFAIRETNPQNNVRTKGRYQSAKKTTKVSAGRI